MSDETAGVTRPSVRSNWGFVNDLAAAAFCAAGAVIVASTALLNDPRFFYTDDYQTYFMPAVREIARLIGQGELPFITDRMWQGGAFLAEYQLAVLHPVSVALYLVIAQFNDLAIAATVFSLAHIAVFAAGTYFLCRTLDCKPRYAVLAAIIAPTTDWLFNWGASNWVVALVSMAWVPWAVGLLVCVYRDTKWFIPAAVAVAMLIVSGWAFGVLALAVLVLTVSVMTLRGPPSLFAWERLRVYLALLAGGLLSAPAVLPMFPYLQFAERPWDPLRWMANAGSLTGVGMPYYITAWRALPQRADIIDMPMVYVAWFVPVILLNAGLKRICRSRLENNLLVLAIAFACLSMLPLLGQFRWMYRLLLYYDLVLLVWVAVICSREDGSGLKWRFWPTCFAVLYPLMIAVITVPALAVFYLASALVVLALIGMSLTLRRRGPTAWVAFAIVSNIAIVWVTNTVYVRSGYPHFPNQWVTPFQMSEPQDEKPRTRRLALFSVLSEKDPGEPFWRDFLPGSTSLFYDVISVNGYSPFQYRSYRKTFCFFSLAATRCKDVVERLTKPVTPASRGLLDLMRIEEVLIQKDEVAEQFRLHATGPWQESRRPTGTTVFTRSMPADSPADPVSWMSAGLGAEVVTQSPRRIVMDVKNEAGTEGTLLLARAWYPGWRAELDGKPVGVGSAQGILISLAIPAGGAGRLVLSYWPAGFWPGVWLACVGLCIMLGVFLQAVFARRRSGV